MKVSEILASVRTHLNDSQGILYPDQVLLPKLQEAQRELHLKMMSKGLPLFTEQTAIFTVPANVIDGVYPELGLIVGYPTNLIVPIGIKEKQVGQATNYFIDMVECSEIPKVQKSTTLRFWSWVQNRLFVLGALVDVQIQLTFRGELTMFSTVNDDVYPKLSENFLSYKCAALALNNPNSSQGGMIDRLNQSAYQNLDDLLSVNVKQMQNLPARKRGYSSWRHYKYWTR